ncbi:MAG TPA: chemotaxis protein CheW [Geobacteraceae bacterium]|nr:chemotaxis protein CheW [Geobacteraceae bacterium]
MSPADNLVVFALDSQPYALALSTVERAVRIVEITPLPQAPEIVFGVINLEGRIIPVMNIRRRFRLPERRPGLSDQLLIARTARRTVALVVDEVRGVLECPAHAEIDPAAIVPGLEYVTGVIKLSDSLLLIHDLDEFLSLEEEEVLAAAINGEDNNVKS